MIMTNDNFQINSAAISDKGLSDKRPHNEDSYLELRESGFFAVADGVGGAQAGDVASQMAMEILGEAFINLPVGGDAEERLKAAVTQANQAIYQMSRDIPKLSTMATTVVGLHVSGNIATIGHVGDSRLYRLDPNGDLFQETQDHSVVEEEVRAGRMTPEQARIHPSKNVISRALGAENTVEVDMKTIMFEPGTSFLLCSDGVNLHINDDELRELLTTGEDTFLICQKIKDICYERGALDNLTAVVVEAVSPDLSPENGFADLEEETVAGVRPPLVDSGVVARNGETRTETLELPETEGTPEVEPAATDSRISIAAADSSEEANTVAAEGIVSDTTVPSKDEKTIRVGQSGTSPGLMSKVLTWLPWALLAVLVAFGAYYIWITQKANSGEIDPQIPNVSMTAFEQNRRNVDANPAQYVAVNSANPKDAVDYYLLGRAYFLQKNYDSAKNNLERAQELIPDRVSAINKDVLQHDIVLMLALINDEETREVFEGGIQKAKEEAAPEPAG